MNCLVISNHSINENTPRSSQLKGIIDILNEINIDTDIYSYKRNNIYNNEKHLEIKKYFVSSLIYALTKMLLIEKNSRYSIDTFLNAFIEKKKYDVVICIVNPFTNGLAGVLLKKLHIANNVIVDSGDPYSMHRRHKQRKFKFIRKKIEKYVSKNCDKFIIPLEQSIPDYPYYNSNYTCIEQVFPSKKVYHDSKFEANKINIVYSGRFYEKFRNPRNILCALKEFKKIVNLHIYLVDGMLDWIKKLLETTDKNWSDWIIIHDTVSREKLLSILESADILLNIENDGINQQPSKLIDYEMSGSYIVNIGNYQPHNGINIDNEINKIKKEIKNIITNKKYTKKSKKNNSNNIKKYKKILHENK